jgi:hypothetical protein
MLLEWMKEGGAVCDKLIIVQHSITNRGVRLSQDVNEGEELLFIPLHFSMTIDVSKQNPIGSQMTGTDFDRGSYLALCILEE